MKSLVCALTMLLAATGIAGELQEAARQGDLEKVRALIAANPAAINARVSATTALHEAVRAGRLEVVKLLVASGAEVNTTNDFSGLTPLKMAIGYHQNEVAAFLRQKGGVEKVLPPARSSPALTEPRPASQLFPAPQSAPAVASVPPAAAPTIVSQAPGPGLVITNKPVDEKQMMVVMFLIHDAARDGDIEKIKELFKNSPGIIEATDQKGMTPLHIAVANRRLTAAQTLLGLHADVNARSSAGQTPLHLATRNADVEMMSLLLKNRARADTRDNAGNSPLWFALQSPEAEAAVATDTSKRKPADKARQWAELLALEKRQFELASLLVQARADVTAPNRSGGIPLAQAVRVGNAPVVELLLKSGANPDAVEPASGKAPLHLAAARADSRIVEVLLRARATVNLTDTRGDTPLCHAMREGRTNSVTALRAAGGTIPRTRALNAMEQALVEAYQKNEAALQRAGTGEKGRIIVGLNPTQADCKRMFPKHGVSAWNVVSQLNDQIKGAFSKPLFDADSGREIWRILPEAPAFLTREWQSRGWLASDLPVFSLSVEKLGSATRPGEYCFVNGRWVLLPPLHRIAAEYASANQGPAK